MFETFIAGSPTLAVAAAVLAVLFLVLVVAAVITNGRDRRRNAAARAGPRFGPEGDDEPVGAGPGHLRVAMPMPAPPVAARRGFGLAALVLAFVVGLAAGIAAMATARDDIAAGLAQLASLVGSDGGPGVGAAPGNGGAPPVGGGGVRPAEAPPGLDDDVAARLAGFAASLEETLPRPAGPELSLTQVEVEGTTLNLGYGVGRVVPPDEVASFEAYIERTVRSLFCAREAREIRYLSDAGVAFHMTYVDPTGITVTELTVTQNFCA